MKFGLKLKFITVISVSVVLVAVIFISLFTSQQRKLLTNELMDRGRILSHNLANNSAYAILAEDKVLLRQLIRNIEMEKDLAYVEIMDIGGIILTSYYPISNPQRPLYEEDLEKEKTTIDFTTSGGEPLIEFVVPVWIQTTEEAESDWLIEKESEAGTKVKEIGNKKIGFIRVGFQQKGTLQNINRLRNLSILITSFTYILLAIFFSLFLNQLVVKPIRQFISRAEAIANGDLEQRVKVTGNDEISQLANSFNRMAESLRKNLDITKDSEEKFSKAFHASPDSIDITSLSDSRMIEVNEGFENIFGITREDAIGRTAVELNIWADPDKRSELLSLLKNKKKIHEKEVSLRNISGEELICELSMDSIIVGGESCFLTVVRDITERKRAADELRKAHQELEERVEERTAELGKLSRAVEQSSVAVMITNKEGVIEYVNNWFTKVTGYSVEEVLGENSSILMSDNNSKAFLKKFWEDLASGEDWNGEYLSKKKNGGEFWTSASISPIKNFEDKITHYVTVAEDITERKRAEELLEERKEALEVKTEELQQANVKLKELDNLKSMFIASMSHELRTPLNSIIGFTGILLMGMVGKMTEEQEKQLSMVKTSANHLLALVNDIIDMSKIEAGKVELLIAHFDLATVVKEVKQSFKVAVEKKNLKLSLRMPRKLVIESDELRIKQILVNLVANAVKFTDEGEVEIMVVKKNGMVEISVRDTGPGVKREHMEKLFKAFSQVPTDGVQKEGTGLGLHLSNKISSLLGGNISAESEFGKGSTFTLTLPSEYGEMKT